jgi:hypothetical protein
VHHPTSYNISKTFNQHNSQTGPTAGPQHACFDRLHNSEQNNTYATGRPTVQTMHAALGHLCSLAHQSPTAGRLTWSTATQNSLAQLPNTKKQMQLSQWPPHIVSTPAAHFQLDPCCPFSTRPLLPILNQIPHTAAVQLLLRCHPTPPSTTYKLWCLEIFSTLNIQPYSCCCCPAHSLLTAVT